MTLRTSTYSYWASKITVLIALFLPLASAHASAADEECMVSMGSPVINVELADTGDLKLRAALMEYANKQYAIVARMAKTQPQSSEELTLLAAGAALLNKENNRAVFLIAHRPWSYEMLPSAVNVATAAVMGCVQHSGEWIDQLADSDASTLALEVAVKALSLDPELPQLLDRIPGLISAVGVPQKGWELSNWVNMLQIVAESGSSTAANASQLLALINRPEPNLEEFWANSNSIVKQGIAQLSYELANRPDPRVAAAYLEISYHFQPRYEVSRALAGIFLEEKNETALIAALVRDPSAFDGSDFDYLISRAQTKSMRKAIENVRRNQVDK